jgi:hypothetical protein
MFEKKRKMRQAAAFDGQIATPGETSVSVETPYLAELAQIRRAVQDIAKDTPVISDGQFGPFMAGISAGIAEPVPRRFHLWTSLSIAAAALVIVIALLSILYPSPESVKANTVESVTTELNGATVDWYDNKDGVTTVWVKTPGGDDL